eukprot:CAMPEP_0172712570 /NCGR_PEP_ID=MMETSP1074-20121228/61176_1 /TAXON_ID=2916 /ORGANISM="Ceratium fusus, Strain PA161109" /LENGTH=145 /DNA_ID=CAMNT_0013536517 /DNA_START=109 /DNA_END=546 /DNA_ORIENTATION=+
MSALSFTLFIAAAMLSLQSALAHFERQAAGVIEVPEETWQPSSTSEGPGADNKGDTTCSADTTAASGEEYHREEQEHGEQIRIPMEEAKAMDKEIAEESYTCVTALRAIAFISVLGSATFALIGNAVPTLAHGLEEQRRSAPANK